MVFQEIRTRSDLRERMPRVPRGIARRIESALAGSEGPLGITGLHCAGKSAIARSLMGGNGIYIEVDTVAGLLEAAKAKAAIEGGLRPGMIIIDEATVLVSRNVDRIFRRFRDQTDGLGLVKDLVETAAGNGVKVMLLYHAISDIPSRIKDSFGITEEIIVPVTLTGYEMGGICEGLLPRFMDMDEQTYSRLMGYRFVSMVPYLLRAVGMGYSPLSACRDAEHQLSRITRRIGDEDMRALRSHLDGRLSGDRLSRFIGLGLVESDGSVLAPMERFIASSGKTN